MTANTFSYIKTGPRTEPCSTPEDTLHGDEQQPSTKTCCKRSLKKIVAM